jgi:streptogramin lyase
LEFMRPTNQRKEGVLKPRFISSLMFLVALGLVLVLASGPDLVPTVQAQTDSVGVPMAVSLIPSTFGRGQPTFGGAVPNLLSPQTFQFVRQWGAQAPAGQFNAPSGVAVDAGGNVYVADSTNQRIQKFDPTGNFILQWGTLGKRNGQFWFPGGVAVDPSGNVWVVDTRNNRIQEFAGSGSFIRTWGSGRFISERPTGKINWVC